MNSDNDRLPTTINKDRDDDEDDDDDNGNGGAKTQTIASQPYK